jgi:putative tryptophan/tyrosine transport system substrate-binding protein
MTRRTIRFLVPLALGLLMAPLAAEAQPVGKVYRIGILGAGTASSSAEVMEVFRQRLRELGWVEGQNIALEWRSAEARFERLPALAAELVQLPVDLLVVTSSPAALAAQQATSTIPIVMGSVGDPIAEGLVTSLAQPGGNLTGVALLSLELNGKRLELLKAAVPGMSRVAVLLNPASRSQQLDHPVGTLFAREVRRAAQALGVRLLEPFEVRAPHDLETTFAIIAREHADGLFVASDALFFIHRAWIADLAVKHRLPTTFDRREYVEAGGLMAYGARRADLAERTATFVDKILKGVKPADLPVEQPTTFELVINLKTAQALGLTIPPTLLFQADELIR